ncbi:MAG: DUF885 domain-containing protein [Tyzzerella sp.]|nr:DUF885 domain-containing protein [Tyzzerella sp.]
MKFKKHLATLFLSFTLLLPGCSNISIPTNADAAFEHFTLELFKQDVASTTLGLHYSIQNPEAYGISDTTITLGSYDVNETASLAAIENCQASLNKFSRKALSKENQLTYDVLSYYLETSKEGVAYALYEEPLSPITGIHAQLPVLLAEYSFYTQDDVDTYLALLETTPDYFASLIRFEHLKSDAGLFMADCTAGNVIEQCNAFLSMGENNYLLSTFEERLASLENLSVEAKNSYISQNKTVLETAMLPAYESLISALTELKGTGKNEQGLCYLSGGKNYYSYLVARETGSARSVDDISALIEKQIAEDILDMHDVISENPTVIEDVSTTVSTSPEKILEDLSEQISSAFPAAKDVNVEVKYVPEALEPYLSPAFYLIPAIDNAIENVIYINQGSSLQDIHLFTTLAHEGYPGHLYQTTYYAAQDPDPLRTLFNFKGYVEGWATYAEMCSYYLSSLEKPYAALLQKNNSLILGLYALTDIGIHYNGWNLERTEQFFSTYGIEDSETIQKIYELIVGDPANYVSYYVGYVEILELKREYIEAKGETFSQKEFHREFLDVGPAPFEIVRKQLLGT